MNNIGINNELSSINDNSQNNYQQLDYSLVDNSVDE
jgi:hypothetical protein